MADGGLEQALTGKVGGIPVWGIGVGLAGLLIAYFAWKNRKADSGDPADNADPNTTDAQDTPDPNAIDPATGLPYSDEAPDSGFPYAPINGYLAGDPTNAAYPVGGVPQGTPGPITNQQWARLAGDWLIGKGNDPTLVGNALNHFINGQAMSTAEEAVVRLAEQAFGVPPEGVTTSTPVPKGADLPAPTGLKVTSHTSTHVALSWSAVPGADYYRVYSDKASGNIGSSNTTSFTVTGLKHHTKYTFHVRAVGHDGNYGAASTKVSVTTSK